MTQADELNPEEDVNSEETTLLPPSEENVTQIFTELLELKKYEDGYQEWVEICRWIKYQETVEPEGNRWSKPHVSTPTLQGWLQLRKSFQEGLILVDVEAADYGSLCRMIGDQLVSKESVTPEVSEKLIELWQKKHRHQFEGPRKTEGKLTTVIKDLLVQKLESKTERSGRQTQNLKDEDQQDSNVNEKQQNQKMPAGQADGKVNVALQKKISSTSEAAIILEGGVAFQEKPLAIFVKLKTPLNLADMPEVDIPTRFFFFYTGPIESEDDQIYSNIGVSLAVALTDKDFAHEVQTSQTIEDVKLALDGYMSNLKILPKDWPEEQKIDPPSNFTKKGKITDEMEEEIDEDRRMREASGLVRTKRFFGGLLNDIKRKKPFYLSDFLHGLHPQCLSSFLFLYFACLAPIVAFGALLGEATENRIATIESLVSGLISGVLFGLFSGQPLILLCSTGPIYIFEKVLYQMCTDYEWDYLSLRLWIGLWVAVMLCILVAFDLSAYVCYITRYTEELFATLIAFIFIVNAFKNVSKIGSKNKFAPTTLDISCACNLSSGNVPYNITKTECLEKGGSLVGEDCDFEPNIFLMSIIEFAGAFFISITLKNSKAQDIFQEEFEISCLILQ